MKVLRISGIVFLFLTSVLTSCEDELHINLEGKPQAIVYFLLNPNDSVQYLKLNKSYLVESNALIESPDSDEVFFSDNVEVSLERWSDNERVQHIRMKYTKDIAKDSGFYPNDQNIIFFTDEKIYPNAHYKLTIHLPEINTICYAETNTVGSVHILDPIQHWNRSITLLPEESYVMKWETNKNTRTFQFALVFNYMEIIDQDTTYKSFSSAYHNYTPTNSTESIQNYHISGSRFLTSLADHIDTNALAKREFQSVDFVLTAAGEELKLYFETNSPNNQSLIETQYTNIVNGQGVFSSISINTVDSLNLSHQTIDSIALSSVTKNLNFADSQGIYY